MADTIFVVRTPFLDGKIIVITGCLDFANDCARETALRTRGEPIWVEEYVIGYEDKNPEVLYKVLYPTANQCSDDKWRENTFVYPDNEASH